jgi:hypothetical protein
VGVARLFNTLNKKRREADVLRCVRHCQRGEYVFAPHAEIDRFFWHAREPFDDAQLTVLSNPLRSEQLGGRQRRRQHRLSPHRVQAGHTDAVVATAAGGSPSVPRHAAVVDNLKSQGRSCLASMPVRPQFNVTELAAVGKQTDLESERLRLALSSWRAIRRRRRHRRHS